MGRPRKQQQPATNGYDQEILRSCLEEIDAADDALKALRVEYMNKCKKPHQQIADALENAKDNGIPLKAFKTAVKNHRLERKIDDNVARLEADDADSYERIIADLGDFVSLPLGAAAAARAQRANPLDGLKS